MEKFDWCGGIYVYFLHMYDSGMRSLARLHRQTTTTFFLHIHNKYIPPYHPPTMEEVKDVTLHIYQLEAPQDSRASWVTRMLPSLGMGAYHTSLQVDGVRYTFAAQQGVVQTRSQREGVPPGATFKESIDLGGSVCTRSQVHQIVKQLGQRYFHAQAYHLVHRNCNHFTETLATCLIMHDQLVEQKKGKLKSYPDWVNRLANTSQAVVGHDDDIVPCQVWEEARKATGADEKIGWNLSSSNEKKTSSKKTTSQTGKKELTDKQKALLAKIRGNK